MVAPLIEWKVKLGLKMRTKVRMKVETKKSCCFQSEYIEKPVFVN